MIKKILLISIPIAMITLLSLGWVFYIDFSRNAALKSTKALLSILHENGDKELEQGLLLSALVNFPENSELKQSLNDFIQLKKAANLQALREKELEIERRDRLEKRIESLEMGILDYQKTANSKQSELDKKLVQALNRSNNINPSQDFYYRITGKRATPPIPRNESRIQSLITQSSDAADQGNWLLAKAQAIEALKLDPQNGKAAIVWSFTSIMEAPESTEVGTRVVPLLESMQKDFPGDFYLSFGLGKAYRSLGQWRLAEDSLIKAFEKRSTSRSVRIEIGALYNDRKDFQKVRSFLDPLWKEGPRDDSLGQILWAAREGTQDFLNAETFLNEWKKAVPRSFLPDLFLGNYWVTKGDLAKALVSYQDSVSATPNRGALIKLAQILESQGQHLKASHAWRGLLGLFNQNLQDGRKDYQKYSPLYLHSLFRAQAYGQVTTEGEGIIKIAESGSERDLMILEVAESLKTLGKWKAITQTIPVYLAYIQDEKLKPTLETIISSAQQQDKQ